MPNVHTLNAQKRQRNRRLLNVPFLDENLSSPDPLVQEKAVAAFPPFLTEYLRNKTTGELLTSRRDNILQGYLKDIDCSELHRRGISLALGKYCFV